MSGFVAVLRRDGAAADRALLGRLGAPLRDVQPDAYAVWHHGPVGMVHAFLSTRDGAVQGPHARGRLRLAGDIRLDDRARLAKSIRDAGVSVLNVDDDDALVLAAYAAWGEAAFARLHGEYAFALWDGDHRRLLCVRDGMGVRPLFYADLGAAFICANHLDAVRAHPGVSSALHDAALVSFLRWGWNVDVHRSAFADIRRLEAGHHLRVPEYGHTGHEMRHWNFPAPPPLRLRDEREYVEGYREVLAAAVKDRLRQPTLSIQLSGGLDSTSLAATAHRVAPAVAVKGFTYAATSLFDDREGVIAAEAARCIGIEHALDETPWRPLAYLDDPSFRTPEPIDDTDYPHTLTSLARMAAHSRVLFVGDDGDSLFAPPGVGLMAHEWGHWETWRRALAYVVAERRLPVLGWHLRDRLRGRPIERVYDPPPAWIRRDVLDRTGPQDFVEPPAHPTRPGTKWLLGAYWQTGQEADSFAYVRLPLEWRWPLLDTRVIEYVLSIPPIPWCQQKLLVRKAFAQELPAIVLARPKTVLPPLPPIVAERWVAAGRPGLRALDGPVDAYVDAGRLRSIFKEGSREAVADAWSSLHLARWMMNAGDHRQVETIDSLFENKEASDDACHRTLGTEDRR
ncbi:MAG: asparagine synthase-related protein [Gemmatimonadota bacterium]|nr:asparagine synthase-related protein [Gemmatimonadota bacterium]